MSRTITISNQIKFNGKKNQPLDYWYGPYENREDCLNKTRTTQNDNGEDIQIRYPGMIVGIRKSQDSDIITDYVFQDGISDEDLIEKIYFNPNSQRAQEIFTEKENNIIGKLQLQIPTLENNTITFPNMSGKTINLLQESDITGLTLDKFTNIKGTLDGKFKDVNDNLTVQVGKFNNFETDITARVVSSEDKINLLNTDFTAAKNRLEGLQTTVTESNTLAKEVQNGLQKANNDITSATARLETLQTATENNSHRFSHYDELIAATRASIEETSDTVAVTGMGGLNNDINHTIMDRSLIELEEKITSMERIPEASVMSAINNSETYKFARIVKYDTIASKDISVSDKVDIIKALFDELNNDTIEDNRYIYIFEDSNKPSTVNYQFSCYYVSQGSQVRELQFKRQFTNSEFTQYQEQEQGATVAGTTKTPYELDINGKKCQYYLNLTNTEYTENILKIYATSYNWKLVTKLYDKENNKYLELLTHDTTGDNIADVNEQYYQVVDVHNNGVINFEYILKDEYKQEGENSYIYNTIAKLTNNGEINTKTIYLICYKDGRLKNEQAEEYGFYFQPYVWYNGSVYRLNTTVTMGYTFTGQNWEYTDPIDIREGVENYTGNVDDVIYITETQTKISEKVINAGSPATPEANKIIISDLGENNIVDKNDLHTIIRETNQILIDEGKNSNPNDLNSEFYNLSQHFERSNSYNNLSKEKQCYIKSVDSILSNTRKIIINDHIKSVSSIKFITYALTSSIIKNDLINHIDINNLYEYYENVRDVISKELEGDNIIDIFAGIFGINENIDDIWVYVIMNTLINYNDYKIYENVKGFVQIYNLINNIFKLNYNLLQIKEDTCALDIFCIFLNDLQKLDEKFLNNEKISHTFIKDFKFLHEDAKPEIKPIIEKITTTTVTKIPKTNLDTNWYKKNTVVVFLIDVDDNGDGVQTYTFEYRKWNKYIKDWVDYGMETITINLGTALNWTVWKPKPSLDLLITENRKTQRNLFKSTQSENETRKIINNDLNKLSSTINVSNLSQAQNNAMIVDMINKLTSAVNTLNLTSNNKVFMKGLNVNNDGLLVQNTVYSKIDSSTGNVTEMTSNDIQDATDTKITASESKPISIVDTNTLQTTIVGVAPVSKTNTKITLK